VGVANAGKLPTVQGHRRGSALVLMVPKRVGEESTTALVTNSSPTKRVRPNASLDGKRRD
jgi:hypothetical protein